MLETGVCDPASVNTWALENSASIAGSMLTTEALICERVKAYDPSADYNPEFTMDVQKEAAEKQMW